MFGNNFLNHDKISSLLFSTLSKRARQFVSRFAPVNEHQFDDAIPMVYRRSGDDFVDFHDPEQEEFSFYHYML